MKLKKMFLKGVLIAVVLSIQTTSSFAQNQKNDSLSPVEKPTECNIAGVNEFANIAYDTYAESVAISSAINFYQIKIEKIEDKGNGVTQKVTVTNGHGLDVTPLNTLVQLGELSLRALKQNENLQSLKDKHIQAQEALKGASFMQKAKGGVTFSQAVKLETSIISETAKQLKIINQQIETLKMIKNN